jgi:alpha-1,2-mannosyltransferase
MTASPRARLTLSRRLRTRAITGASWLIMLAVVGYLCYSGAAGPMRDLQVYRDGALAMRHGRDLYTMLTATGLPYTYPPVGAVLAMPLTLVPLPAARIAWDAMVCLPLAAVVWFGFRPLLGRAGRAAPAVFACLLGCCALLLPVREEFYFGQVDIFLVALCVADLQVRNPRWPRGLLIGLATAIKLEPGVFIIYLLITRRRRDAAVAALSFAGWTALAWLIDPHDSVTYWTSAVFQTNRLGGNSSAANQSLRGMILRLFNPHPAPSSVWLAAALVVALAGFAAARRCWQRGDDMAGIAITGLLSAALSPVAWIHHFCWLIVALGVIVGDGRSRGRAAAAIAAFALFISSLPTWAEHARGLGVVPVRLFEDAFGLAALAIVVIIYRIVSLQGGERGVTVATAGRPAPSSSVARPSQQLPSAAGQRQGPVEGGGGLR